MDTLRRIESGERFSAQEVSEVQRIMANETLAMQALTRLQRGLEELHSSTDPDQPKKIEGDD
jgi:predicted DNA-binding protein